jgi:hypothetical protein
MNREAEEKYQLITEMKQLQEIHEQLAEHQPVQQPTTVQEDQDVMDPEAIEKMVESMIKSGW